MHMRIRIHMHMHTILIHIHAYAYIYKYTYTYTHKSFQERLYNVVECTNNTFTHAASVLARLTNPAAPRERERGPGFPRPREANFFERFFEHTHTHIILTPRNRDYVVPTTKCLPL